MNREFKKLFPSFVKQETKDEKALELYYFTDAVDAYSFAECQVAAYVKKRKPYWIAYVDTYPIQVFIENAVKIKK